MKETLEIPRSSFKSRSILVPCWARNRVTVLTTVYAGKSKQGERQGWQGARSRQCQSGIVETAQPAEFYRPAILRDTCETASLSIKTKEGPILGDLKVPAKAEAIVLFAHGSGSSRFSLRNQYVARALNQNGLGTLLMDLLTPEEENEDKINNAHRFNIPLLSLRLKKATEWILHHRSTARLKIGYFGASTGAAVALTAASDYPAEVKAIVSRGGRPDLAHDALANIHAPVLLIVGENDRQVLELNQNAFTLIASQDKKLEVIPGATHLFEEPGALEKVAGLAVHWFCSRLL